MLSDRYIKRTKFGLEIRTSSNINENLKKENKLKVVCAIKNKQTKQQQTGTSKGKELASGCIGVGWRKNLFSLDT